MSSRRLALPLAFVLLAPLAGAHCAASLADAQGDERVRHGYTGTGIPVGTCSAPAADILGLGYDLDGDNLTFRLAVLDAEADMACLGQTFPLFVAQSSVFLHDANVSGSHRLTLAVDASPGPHVRVCFFVPGSGPLSCETRARADVFDGSEWTVTLPTHGALQRANGTLVPYDLRGGAYHAEASTRVTYLTGGPLRDHMAASDSAGYLPIAV